MRYAFSAAFRYKVATEYECDIQNSGSSHQFSLPTMWPRIRKDLQTEYATPRSRRGNFNQYGPTTPADLGAQSLQDSSNASTAEATTVPNTPANQPSVSLTKTLATPMENSTTNASSRADNSTPLDQEGNLASEQQPTPALENEPSSVRSISRGEPKSTAGTTVPATPAAPGSQRSQLSSQQSDKSGRSTTGGSNKSGTGSLKPSGNIIPIIPLDNSDSSESAQPAPSKPNVIDLSKYDNLELDDMGLDVRPRIRNIIEELYSEHDWSWPPAPAKDVRKTRFFKRKKNKIFYNQHFYDFCTFLSIIIGPLELLVAIIFALNPKTFVLAMRECVEIVTLVICVFVIQGLYHSYAGILGLALRASKPFEIGFVYAHWSFQVALPLLGIFCVFACMYMTQDWMVEKEMVTHLKGYNFHWYSKNMWDHYQKTMHCCGIVDYNDWKNHGPLMYDEKDGRIFAVPESCCSVANCSFKPSSASVWNVGCLVRTMSTFWAIYAFAALCVIVSIILMCIGHRSVEEAGRYGGDPIHKLLFDDRWSKKRLYNRSNRREELFFLLNHYCMILGRELGLDDEVAAAEAEEKERLNGRKYGSMDEDPFMGGDTFTGNSPPTPGSLDHFLDDMYLPVKKEHILAPAPVKDTAQDSNMLAEGALERTNAAEVVLNPELNIVSDLSSTYAVESVQFEKPHHMLVKTTDLLTGTERRGAQTSSSHEFLTPICAIDETTYALAQEVRDSFTGAEEHIIRVVAEGIEAEEQARARALLWETEHSNILHPSERVPEHVQKKEALTDLEEGAPEGIITVLPPDNNAHMVLDSAAAHAQQSGASEQISAASSSDRPLNSLARAQLPTTQGSLAQQDDSLFSIAERSANLAAFKELMESLTSSASGSKNQPDPSAIAKTYSDSDISSADGAPKKLEQTKKKGHEYDGAAAEKIPVPRKKTGIPSSSTARKAKAIPVPVKTKLGEKIEGAVDAKGPKESRLPMRARQRK